jgi:four helix bundle protein
MRSEIPPFERWVASVEPSLADDPVWRMTAYRMAMYSVVAAWGDVTRLARCRVTEHVAGQLYRALGSIGANLAEGYSRSSGADRARLFEYALGSARESVVWYRTSAPLLGQETIALREAMLQQIVRILLVAIPSERRRTIRPPA